jgi:hypothetical protein
LEGFRGLRILQITGVEVDAKNENSVYREGRGLSQQYGLSEATEQAVPSPHIQLCKYSRPQAELFKK